MRYFPPSAGRLRASPLLFPAGLACSAIIIIYLANHALCLAACAAAVPLGGLAVAWLFHRRHSHEKGGLLLLGVAVGLILGGAQGYALWCERARSFAGIPTASVRFFRAVLVSDSIVTSRGTRLYSCSLISVATRDREISAQARGSVLVYADEGPVLRTGELVNIEGVLRETPLDSEVRFVSNAAGKRVTSLGFTSPLFAARAGVLDSLLNQISLFGEPAASLFEALFLGVRDNLEFELKDSFVKTGSLHLLALSGLNVGMIVALLMLALFPLRSRRLKTGVAAIMILVYLFIVGPEASLLRAVLMLLLAGAALALDRKPNPHVILCLSAAIVILIDPASLRSLSFKLSYLALAGILTLGKRLDEFLIPWLPRPLRTIFAAAVGAQVFTLPLVLSINGSVYPVGILVSLFLIPLTTAYIWSGVIVLLLTLVPLPFFIMLARLLMGWQYQLIRLTSDFFKAAPGVSLVWHALYWIPASLIMLLCAFRNPIRRVYELRRSV